MSTIDQCRIPKANPNCFEGEDNFTPASVPLSTELTQASYPNLSSLCRDEFRYQNQMEKTLSAKSAAHFGAHRRWFGIAGETIPATPLAVGDRVTISRGMQIQYPSYSRADSGRRNHILVDAIVTQIEGTQEGR